MATATKQRTRPRVVRVQPTADWVRPSVMADITGYTEKAMERKREEGKWVEGEQWAKAPDGNIVYSISGYNAWVTSNQKLF